VENLQPSLPAPTAVNVTVRQRQRPREYLTEREIERLMKAAGNNRWAIGMPPPSCLPTSMAYGLASLWGCAGMISSLPPVDCTSVEPRAGSQRASNWRQGKRGPCPRGRAIQSPLCNLMRSSERSRPGDGSRRVGLKRGMGLCQVESGCLPNGCHALVKLTIMSTLRRRDSGSIARRLRPLTIGVCIKLNTRN